MLAGCAILDAICRDLAGRPARVADRGVREGILLRLLLRHRVRDDLRPQAGAAAGRVRRAPPRCGSRPPRGRTPSSTEWLAAPAQRPLCRRRRGASGYRSRAAFKLIELDDRFSCCAAATRVVDLGCGARRLDAGRGCARQGSPARAAWSAIDLARRSTPVAGATHAGARFPRAGRAGGDQRGARRTGRRRCCPTWRRRPPGMRATDHVRIVALAEAAYEFAARGAGTRRHLRRQGYQGGAEGELLARAQARFRRACATPSRRRAGPNRPRVYVVAQGVSRRSIELPRRACICPIDSPAKLCIVGRQP